MSYAHREGIYDADTYMMQPGYGLSEFADNKTKPLITPLGEKHAEALVKAEQALEAYHKRQADPQLLAELEGSFMSMVQTGFVSLGEFDRDERKRINDLLGFDGHIVFPTTSFDQIQGATQPAAFAVSVEALNRGLHYFCETDKRILPAPYLPFRFESKDPLDHVASVIKQDFSMIMIDRVAPAVARAFTQPDFDPAWARIQDAELAVTIHVGTDGGWDPVPLSFYNNGGSVPAHQEANVPRDALACMSIQYNAELFLAAMVFDDAFERFPRLRVAVVELGASWIISWTKRLDQSFRALRRLQDLSQVKMQPSEYVLKHIKLTPFADQDIGWLLKSGAEDMLMFASDYPHHEGYDDPIARFERKIDGIVESMRQKLYVDNFKAFFGPRLQP